MDNSKKNPKCKDIPLTMWYPKNSVSEEMSVFRLTFNKNRIIEKDFLSKYELDKINGKDTKKNEDKDTYFGLSVLEEKEDAEKVMKKVPTKSSSGIARGVTKDGLIRRTPSCTSKSHVTWWPFEDAKPIENFEIVMEDEHE